MQKLVLLFLFITPYFFNCSFTSSSNQKEFNNPVLDEEDSVEIVESIPPSISISSLFDSLSLTSRDVYLKVEKLAYCMHVVLIKNDSIIKTYPVVFGFNAEDDKRMQGDGCTPEGTFYIHSKYPHKDWHKFIWLNYPTEDSWKKHNASKQAGDIPADAKIGGEIGIHGIGGGENYDYMIDQRNNWTLGCVAMKDKDVDEIYSIIDTKMKIVIEK